MLLQSRESIGGGGAIFRTEVESSRTSLACRTSSRTHFEVVGLRLGLEGQVLGLGLWPRVLENWPQVLENWPVLGSRTTLFFKLLKFCVAPEKFFGRRFFLEIALKVFVKTFFFGEHLRLCPWSLTLASSVPVLGLERVCPRKGCP